MYLTSKLSYLQNFVMYRLLLLSISLNCLGTLCAPTNFFYKLLEDSASNANLSCKTLRNSALFSPKPNFLSDCKVDPSKDLQITKDQFLCMLYYNNFMFLCDKMNNVSDSAFLNKLFLPKSIQDSFEGASISKVCPVIKGNMYYYKGFDELKNMASTLNSVSCSEYCLDSESFEFSPMCKAIDYLITATTKIIAFNRSASASKPHVTTSEGNRKDGRSDEVENLLGIDHSLNGDINSQLGTFSKNVQLDTKLNTQSNVVQQQTSNEAVQGGQQAPNEAVQGGQQAPNEAVQGSQQAPVGQVQSVTVTTTTPASSVLFRGKDINDQAGKIQKAPTGSQASDNISPVQVNNGENDETPSHKSNDGYPGFGNSDNLDENKAPLNKNSIPSTNPSAQSNDPHNILTVQNGAGQTQDEKKPKTSEKNEGDGKPKTETNVVKGDAAPPDAPLNDNTLDLPQKVKEGNEIVSKGDKELAASKEVVISQEENVLTSPGDFAKDSVVPKPVLEPNKIDKNEDNMDEYGNQGQDFIEDQDSDREVDLSPVRENPKSSEVKINPMENAKPHELIEDDITLSANYQNQNIEDSDSYFFSYFMMICIMFICGYVAYHNKQKILALVVEGRQGRRNSRSRRPNSANYRKLDSNLEEAVTSSCTKNTTQIIY